MAGICTTATTCAGGGHHAITSDFDGVSVTSHLTEAEAATPLTADELDLLHRLSARRKRVAGVVVSQFVGRVLHGDEATNVKTYDLIASGAAITKTNIGASYVNISPRANGERRLVDFTGCTEYRLIASANLVGSGPFGMRVVRDSDSAVLYENANIALTGERELDTDWQPLPAAAAGLVLVRVQAKSATASDDPVFGGVTLVVR